MSTRDWDKELAMIDRQLAALSDDKLGATSAAAPPRAAPAAAPPLAPSPGPALRPSAVATTNGTAAVPSSVTFVHTAGQPRTWRSRAIVTGKLLFAVGVAAVVTPIVWPLGFRCGVDLALYLGAIGLAVLSGLWAARASWRYRAGFAHTLSLLVVLWGLSLAAWLTLPRVGLGLPDEQRITVWQCS